MPLHSKIIATLGPATHTAERVEELILAGMNCARLNLSHGTHEHHARAVALVRKAAHKLDRTVSLMADLQGPKIRVGAFAKGLVKLKPGHAFVLSTKRREGDEHGVSVSYKALADDVKPGNRVFLADGLLELLVTGVTGHEVHTQVLKGGVLRNHQGINLPGAALSTQALTPKDRKDALFALEQGVDFIALSFVRTTADIHALREHLSAAGGHAHIIAKIEKPEALDNLEAVIQAADGVMVARGDLGVELPLWAVPQAQRRVIREAARHGKFVITATQMLESMVEHPRPTRAEVTDIAAAVMDGTDALMLSAETAMGAYPVEAVRIMREVAQATEERPDYNPWHEEFTGMSDFLQAAAAAAAEAARRLNAKAVLSLTMNGMMPRLLSRHHFRAPVLAVSHDESLLRKLTLVWGVLPLCVGVPAEDETAMDLALVAAKERGYIAPGDDVVITFGMAPRQFNSSNVVRLHRVE